MFDRILTVDNICIHDKRWLSNKVLSANMSYELGKRDIIIYPTNIVRNNNTTRDKSPKTGCYINSGNNTARALLSEKTRPLACNPAASDIINRIPRQTLRPLIQRDAGITDGIFNDVSNTLSLCK